MRLLVVTGHGAGDSGAVGYGFTEAERVRALANRMKALGGNSVILGDQSINWYRSNTFSSVAKNFDCAIELHMDSASATARGGHVIINGNYTADQYDNALANFIGGFFPGRSKTIVGRNDLANANRTAARGINYRLLEVCFISNQADLTKFNNNLDTIARGILAAFGIGAQQTSTEKLDFCILQDPDKLRVGVAYDESKYKNKVVFDFVYRDLNNQKVWLPIAFQSKGNWVDFKVSTGKYQIVCKMYNASTKKIIVEKAINVDKTSSTVVTATNASWQNDKEILLGFTVNNANIPNLKYRALLFDKSTGKWFDRRNGQWTTFQPNKKHKYAVMFQAYLDDKNFKDGRVIAQKQINVL